MLSTGFHLFAFLLLVDIPEQILAQTNNPNVHLWPYPQSISTSASYLTINSTTFKIVDKSTTKCTLLDKAITRYQELSLLQDCSKLGPAGNKPDFKTVRSLASDSNNKGEITTLTVEITKCEEWPYLHMNESYDLKIDSNGALIHAISNWGAIRALESFSQLIQNVGHNQFIINQTTISDFPRFAYRGLMVDTARHYIPVDILYHNLDAMAFNKLNVFHWHIVDDQSFPYVSKKFPELSQKGAYDPETHIYTQEDVKNIIEYARERGIRVIAEFDSPGHVLSWGKSQPGLLTPCYSGSQPSGSYGPIDPTKNSSYDFIRELFTEISQVFPDQYYHLGGDEVDFSCWNSNPSVKDFMKQHGITDGQKLEDYYVVKALDIVKSLNRSYIVWEEVFNDGVELKPDTVVQVWKGSWGSEKERYWRPELANVTKKGFQAILSSCWYLDLISYGHDWQSYYLCDPQSFTGTAQQHNLVIGGEPAMWTELVDGSNVISRIWPRASAAAERLWSPSGINSYQQASPRFDRFRCHMQRRGVRAHPNNGPGYCKCDYAM